MEYQVEMVYEKEDVAALVKALEYRRQPEKHIRRANQIVYPIFGWLLVITGFGTLAAIATMGIFSIETVVITLAGLIGGVALLRRSNSNAMVNRSWNRYPNKGVTMTYTFYKDRFTEVDRASGEHEFPYISVTSVNEDENHYFLFNADNAAHMIRKDSFIHGDPVKFADFIHEKAAVTIDPID